jgi:hypothetical protein
LVFIDGGHTFKAAFTDYTNWVSHLLPDGYLLIHDIFLDPSKGGQAPYFIYQLALSSGLFEGLSIINTLGILKRSLHKQRKDEELNKWFKQQINFSH